MKTKHWIIAGGIVSILQILQAAAFWCWGYSVGHVKVKAISLADYSGITWKAPEVPAKDMPKDEYGQPYKEVIEWTETYQAEIERLGAPTITGTLRAIIFYGRGGGTIKSYPDHTDIYWNQWAQQKQFLRNSKNQYQLLMKNPPANFSFHLDNSALAKEKGNPWLRMGAGGGLVNGEPMVTVTAQIANRLVLAPCYGIKDGKGSWGGVVSIWIW